MYKTLEGSTLPEERQLSMKLGALLHDADDRKYFASDSKNAENIITESLSEVDQEKILDNHQKILDDTILMISMVSASGNGNKVPPEAIENPELLWVRFCDRLEAIGPIGAVRCYQYAVEKGNPLDVPGSTPKPQSAEEVWSHVKPERFEEYQRTGASASMLDHYYDKLLQIAHFDPKVVQNEYLQNEASRRVQPLVDVCLEYGKNGEVP